MQCTVGLLLNIESWFMSWVTRCLECVHLLQYGKAVRICGMLLKTNAGQAKLAAAYFQHVQVSNVNIHELNADDLTTRFPMLKEAQAGGAPGWADRLVSCHFLVDCPMCES